MIGSLLVFGFVLISVIVAFAFYFNRFLWLRFLTLALLFAWSSSVFFLLYNYEGWPTSGDYPRSRVVSIEVLDPTPVSPGRIFVWVYHVNQVNKRFYEYNPDGIPRAYEIPYVESKGDVFKKAEQLLEKGFVIYIGKNEGEGFSEGENGEGEGTGGTGGDLKFPYERGKPPLEAINPQNLMPQK